MDEATERGSIFNMERILLEVSVFFYFIAKNSVIPLVQQYVYVLVARKYNYTEMEPDASETCVSEVEDRLTAELRHQVNEESSLIVLYLNLAELLPSCIIVLAMGCWSDVTGKRKFLMWLPCLGNAVYVMGFILPSYIYGGEFTSGAAAIVVTSTIMAGLSGNIHGFMAGNACYISDTDSISRRTLRLSIVEAIIGTTFGLSSLYLGFWIRYQGFFQPLWFTFFCSLIPLFLIIFGISEPKEATKEHAPTVDDFRSMRHICGCATLSQRKLWAMFFAYIIYVFVQQGQERTNILYLENYPLCWGPVNIGVWLFVLMFLAGLGSWPGVPLLHKVMGDLPIFIIALISKALGSFVLAFANSSGFVYIAAVIQIFHLTPYALGRSLVSRQVGLDEQGTVYGLLHSAQALVGFLGPLVHNAVFFGSLGHWNGAVFLLSGALLVVPFLLLGWWMYMEKQESEYDMVEQASYQNEGSGLLTPGSRGSESSGLIAAK